MKYLKHGISNTHELFLICIKLCPMDALLLINENEYLDTGLLNSKQEMRTLIPRIAAQHTFILNKLLPEIDMHFEAVLNQDFSSHTEEINSAYLAFSQFAEMLRDHIYFEDSIVLPVLFKENWRSEEHIAAFLHKHDDFEVLIRRMLEEVTTNLKYLSALMPFRILLIKMERLRLLLEEHGRLEDLLFGGQN